MTPQEQQHIDLIQKYLQGTLPPMEMQQMKQDIQQNPTFAQEVADYQFLIEGIEAVGASNFAVKVASWEEKYCLKESYVEEIAETTYTLEELLEMFSPVSAYEKRISKELAGTRHLGGFKVEKPENGRDCSKQLNFELVTPINDALKLIIENNEEDEVWKETIAPHTKAFEVSLKNWKPGRYYWKLRSKKYGMILRSFFVQKHLNPSI